MSRPCFDGGVPGVLKKAYPIKEEKKHGKIV